jgi:hypothetical protein
VSFLAFQVLEAAMRKGPARSNMPIGFNAPKNGAFVAILYITRLR